MNVKNERGTTPLHGGAREGHTEIVQALLKAGAEVDATVTDGYYKGYTPLHFAAERGEKKVALLLLKAGADMTAKDENGDTPLHWAAFHGSKDIITIVILLYLFSAIWGE